MTPRSHRVRQRTRTRKSQRTNQNASGVKPSALQQQQEHAAELYGSWIRDLQDPRYSVGPRVRSSRSRVEPGLHCGGTVSVAPRGPGRRFQRVQGSHLQWTQGVVWGSGGPNRPREMGFQKVRGEWTQGVLTPGKSWGHGTRAPWAYENQGHGSSGFWGHISRAPRGCSSGVMGARGSRGSGKTPRGTGDVALTGSGLGCGSWGPGDPGIWPQRVWGATYAVDPGGLDSRYPEEVLLVSRGSGGHCTASGARWNGIRRPRIFKTQCLVISGCGLKVRPRVTSPSAIS